MSRIAAPGYSFRLNPPAAQLPSCSAVLNGKGRSYRVEEYRTSLSVKSVTRGAALYTTRRGRHLVTPETFLILNHGQTYAMEFEAGPETETLCPFLQEGLLEGAAGCLQLPPQRRLDDMEARSPSLEFSEHLYPKTGAVARALGAIQRGVQARVPPEGGWLEDRFHDLCAALLSLRGTVRREVESFPGLKASTREELYRRLHRGRDFLLSSFDRKIDTAAIADAASLSPFHFHRMFKQAFGSTPAQVLRERRLAAARRLLLTTDQDVTSICLAVGFESLGSFTWLFRKRFGLPPGRYRAQARARRNTQV